MKNEKDYTLVMRLHFPERYLTKASAFLHKSIEIKGRVFDQPPLDDPPDVDDPNHDQLLQAFFAKNSQRHEEHRKDREFYRTHIDGDDYKHLAMVYTARAVRFIDRIPKTNYGVFEPLVASIKSLSLELPPELREFKKVRNFHEHADDYYAGGGWDRKNFIKSLPAPAGSGMQFIAQGDATGGWIKSKTEMWQGLHVELVSLSRILTSYAQSFSTAFEQLRSRRDFMRLT